MYSPFLDSTDTLHAYHPPGLLVLLHCSLSRPFCIYDPPPSHPFVFSDIILVVSSSPCFLYTDVWSDAKCFGRHPGIICHRFFCSMRISVYVFLSVCMRASICDCVFLCVCVCVKVSVCV